MLELLYFLLSYVNVGNIYILCAHQTHVPGVSDVCVVCMYNIFILYVCLCVCVCVCQCSMNLKMGRADMVTFYSKNEDVYSKFSVR